VTFAAALAVVLGCDTRGPFDTEDAAASPGDQVAPVSDSPAAATSSATCLEQSGPLVTLRGSQKRYDIRKSTPPNLKVDAREASWTGAGEFPVLAGSRGSPGLCWSGGTIVGRWSGSMTWRDYHSTAGMFLASPGFTLEDVGIVNYGDGLRVLDYADDWTIRRVHMQGVRDDCVENDRLYSGLIEDALFEGCYVFLSSRAGSGVKIKVDGRNEMVTIRNTLVHLQPMSTVYKGNAPGTGPLFKWSDQGTMLSISNTIFRIDQKPNHGDLIIPNLKTCDNNTIVWLGSGPYPAKVPSCFRITTDRSVWDRAVAAWKAQYR
jgi:hypothetical protein